MHKINYNCFLIDDAYLDHNEYSMRTYFTMGKLEII